MVKFTKININDIKPADYNPRIMKPSEQLKLKKNLETFGLVDPIIVDLTDNNTVIGGHQRLEVLKDINPDMDLKLLKLNDIGLVFWETDFKIKDKNDQKALNLSLNKITGEFDYTKVDDLLVELNDDNYLIELTGFDESDLNLEETSMDIDLDDIIFKEEEPNKINEDGTINTKEVVEKTITCPRCHHEFQL